MADVLSSQLGQLAFAIVTGQHRLTDEQRQAIADLNAACAIALTPLAGRSKLELVPYTKEPA